LLGEGHENAASKANPITTNRNFLWVFVLIAALLSLITGDWFPVFVCSVTYGQTPSFEAVKGQTVRLEDMETTSCALKVSKKKEPVVHETLNSASTNQPHLLIGLQQLLT
jgi:hypothetical protein